MPLTKGLKTVEEIPHTLSMFIRKMSQIASFNELPKEKRPPEYIWDNADELEDWFDRVFDREEKGKPGHLEFNLDDLDIEG